jgi:antitoxin component YwqK of YwqJK toxin-antitoxin module
MKKQIAILFLFFISFLGHSQFGPNDEAVYLDSLENLGTEENFKHIRIVKDFTLQKELYEVSFFYRSGKIEMRGTTKNKSWMTYEGPCVYFYENGNRKKIINYFNSQILGKQFEWYENGNVKLESEIVLDKKTNNTITKIVNYWNSNNEQKVIDGEGEYEETETYTMANKKPQVIFSKGTIKNFLKEGTWIGNSPQDKYNFTEEYTNGKLISGKIVDNEGVETTYTDVEIKPTPVKGMWHFYDFIARNYETPKVEGLQGKVYVTFIVEKDGNISDIKVIRDIGYGTGAEAIRVLSKYGYWLPGKQRGVPVRVMYSLPITIHSTFSMKN